MMIIAYSPLVILSYWCAVFIFCTPQLIVWRRNMVVIQLYKYICERETLDFGTQNHTNHKTYQFKSLFTTIKSI